MESSNNVVFCVWLLSLSIMLLRLVLPIFKYFDIYIFLIFIYLFMAVLGLCFCARDFSSCGKRGPLFITVRGPLTIAASLVGSAGSVVVAHGPSRSAACGIFSDQGSNPCPLHWQADSQPLRHQGSPWYIFNLQVSSSIPFFPYKFSIEEAGTFDL